jgi:hypothetical protein
VDRLSAKIIGKAVVQLYEDLSPDRRTSLRNDS